MRGQDASERHRSFPVSEMDVILWSGNPGLLPDTGAPVKSSGRAAGCMRSGWKRLRRDFRPWKKLSAMSGLPSSQPTLL